MAGIVLFTLALGAAEFDHTIYDQYRIALLEYSYPAIRLSFRYDHDNSTEDFYRYDLVGLEQTSRTSDLDMGLRWRSYLESEKETRVIDLITGERHDFRGREVITDRTETVDQTVGLFDPDVAKWLLFLYAE